MEEIRGVINSIIKGCGQAGVIVPEVLAAFVARTVSLYLYFFYIIKR